MAQRALAAAAEEEELYSELAGQLAEYALEKALEDKEAYWEAYSDLAEQLAEQALEEAEEALEDEEAYWEAYSDLAEQLAEQALEEAEEALEEAEEKAALATEEALEKGALKEHLDELGAERAQKLQWASEFRVGDEVYVQGNLFWMAAVVAGKGPGGIFGFLASLGWIFFRTTGNVPTTRSPKNSR